MGGGGFTTSALGHRDKIPGSLDGITDYYRQRGYQQDPVLESKQQGQVTSFVKPLPDGARAHVRVFRTNGYYTIRTHRDPHDPARDPIGHLQDIVLPPDEVRRRVARTDLGNAS